MPLIRCLSLIFALCAVPMLLSAEQTAPDPIEIDRLLALGPLPIDAELLDQAGHADELRRSLVNNLKHGPLPRDGQSVSAFGRELDWRRTGIENINDERKLGVLWVQLESDRFVRGHLKIQGLRDVLLYVDGAKSDSGENGHALDLRNGSHSLWIVHAGQSGDTPARIRWTGRDAHDQITAHTRPERRVSARLLSNAETVGTMAVSPDGQLLALAFERYDDLAESQVRRLEIRELASGRVLQSWVGQHPSSLAWSPDGTRLAMQTGGDLWLHEPASGQARSLLLAQEGIGSWRWHPDSESILFAWTHKDDSDTEQRKRLRALEDRWSNFRDRQQIYQIDTASGLVRALTAADQSVRLHDVDANRLLLSERVIDYAEPPHSLHRIFEFSLDDLEQREIARLRLFNDVRFAEDGYWLLAGPGLAVGDGKTSAEELIANEYDTQLYRLSVDGQTATSLSRDFDPAISGIEVLADGQLLLTAIDGERSALVQIDPANTVFHRIETGLEVIESVVASRTAPATIIVRGSSATEPQRVVHLDPSAPGETLVDTAGLAYADTHFGEVRDWDFVNTDGDTIEGRYYLPPDFDESQRYPLIVYYYGGTTPVNRQFTGRYPFNLWAANGYVIYVLQPRGTIGYGQDFSARHVNAWGEYTADDIIEGSQRFLDSHDFVDSERVGNIGASYGGFMTMYLATKTDLFAASISHAGISTLTSYWGEGWWGYGYSGIASRGSFPWNNRELYVEHSPIYSADRITTPLLLLHGDSDTNVPPGESHTMFTALRLLGREVEMVEFPGEDHWILDREKRYVWWDTILAWYDRWLKDEPQWWQQLYPEPGDSSGRR